jgi:hypothetical protein
LLLEYRVLVSPRKVHFEFGVISHREINAIFILGGYDSVCLD